MKFSQLAYEVLIEAPKINLLNRKINFIQDPRTGRFGGSVGKIHNRTSSKILAKNVNGKRFGRLVALETEVIDSKSRTLAKCDCGNEVIVVTQSLIRGSTTSCGCKNIENAKNRVDKFHKDKDIIDKISLSRINNTKDKVVGKKFGRLEVIEHYVDNNGIKQRSKAIAKCECGNVVDVTTDSLLNGTTKSCGCLNSEIAKNTHANKVKDKIYPGKKFGLLTANERYIKNFIVNRHGESKQSSEAWWKCSCDCGNPEYHVRQAHLIRGMTKSCGCKSKRGRTERVYPQVDFEGSNLHGRVSKKEVSHKPASWYKKIKGEED